MRDFIERLLLLPFSIDCFSKSIITASANHPKKAKLESNPPITRGQGQGESSSSVKMKNSLGFLDLLKPYISSRFRRLTKSFKKFCQLFVYKDEVDEREMEMEIGLPTDVKHVTHIGWDGSITTNPMKGWDNLKAPELLSLPTISLRQFELAMSAQAGAPFVIASSELGN